MLAAFGGFAVAAPAMLARGAEPPGTPAIGGNGPTVRGRLVGGDPPGPGPHEAPDLIRLPPSPILAPCYP